MWQASPEAFLAVAHVNRQPLGLLKGIDRAAEQLLDNTRRFAHGPARQQRPAVGRARHGQVVAGQGRACRGAPRARARSARARPISSSSRSTARTSPRCPPASRTCAPPPSRFIVFCDDLSFDKDDTSYKSLKAVLEGGIEGRPENVLFYATSNRRHLMPRDMMENERSTAINPSEAVEEKVSLSDRFGLWLGFHNATQDEYLDMVRSYAAHHKLKIEDAELVREALEWSMTRGARSGRVAWQFIQDLAGRLGQRL